MNAKRTIAKWLLLILFAITAIMPAMTVQADTDVNEDVRNARKGILQIQFIADNVNTYFGGTGFLINEDTILTCYHVVHLDSEELEYIQHDNPDAKEEDFKIKVVVMNDIILDAKIINESQVADFAILELEQPIYDRTPLPLNSDENVSETQKVYGLGFPAAVVSSTNLTAYTYQDVTVSDGRVTKITDVGGVKYVQHSANLTAGDSGGPLVAEDGSVIAMDRGVRGENDDYSYSVAISQLRSALDALGISYIDAALNSGPSPKPTEDVTSSSSDSEATTPAEVDTTKKAPALPNTNDDIKEEKESGLSPVVLAAIIGVIVVVLIVVIILIVTLGKGKKGAAQLPAQMPPIQGQRPVPPVQQSPYVDEGMAATTVLNEGAGETTVLNGGGQMQARTLIRIKTGERIQMNQPEYTIGKERRRVDYCISDNNSISRVHAKLVNRGGQLFLIDMNATNGTFINGTKLSPNQEVRISSGDRFKLADEEFQIQ